jgi:tight adherence protein B
VRRIALITAVVASFLALVGTSAGASSGGLTVVEAKGPAFPTRTLVLTLPTGRKLSNRDVRVTENSGSVVQQSLVPASEAAPKTFGTMLVLDSSYSMIGKPLNAAIAAAQAFVAQRNPNDQLGIIEFNRNVTVALPLTTSATKIGDALANKPVVTTGTHIYDAVAQAEKMLTGAGISSGSIVVLSDGADTGSTQTVAQVGHMARVANTKIYTVGLEDASYNSHALKALAHAGKGAYAKAKAKDLAAFFRNLSQELSSQYLLSYKSQVPLGTSVKVEVIVNGVGTETTGYETPRVPVTTTTPPTYKPSLGSRIWGSEITMILIALLGAGVIALLVIGALQPRRSGLPKRMAEFVSIRSLQRDKGEAAAQGDGDEATQEQTNFWTRFEETLEIAEIKIEPEWIVAGTVALTGLTFILILAGTGSPWWALFALGIPYLSREWVLRTLARRRNKFAEQLPDALQVISSALRSGHSFAGALAVVVESASEPMKKEMQRVVADEQRGVRIQESLGVVAERMASRDVEQLALVAQLQREAGGDAAEVVDRVAETVRERFDLKRLIATLTMQGRMTRWIVSALPIFVLIVIRLENPHYFHPLLSTLGGKVVFGAAALWATIGSFIIKKIVEIEV